MKDEKYVVFKRAEFDEFVSTHREVFEVADPWLFPNALEDAVVIRTQDLFAASGLYAYAHTIMTHIGLMDKTATGYARAGRLREIADYFFDRAREAEETVGKIPD